MSDTGIKIFIIEDYKLVRVGLISVIKAQEGFVMVGEASNGEEGVEKIKQVRPDIVLMDLGLPRMDGIEATRLVKEFDPEIKVIILTSHETDNEVLAALASGANAYCLKDIPTKILTQVIESVHAGALWLDPKIAAVALNFFTQASGINLSGGQNEATDVHLTPREYEILKQIVDGRSNSEIAGSLQVSVHTIKVQVSNILQKLAVSDRVQAAVKAIKEGIV